MEKFQLDKADLILIFALVGAISAICSFIATFIINKLARSRKLFDLPGSRRVHSVPTPRLGGVAVVFAFLCGLVVLQEIQIPAQFFQTLLKQLPSSFLIGTLILFVAGILDDIFGLSAIVKLFLQIASVTVLMFDVPLGNTVLGYNVSTEIMYVAYLFWFLVFINAFNLIDGVDGLATPLAIVALLGLLGLLVIRVSVLEAVIVSSYIGALIGFYPWNRYPAKIFLGDCGSMMNGFIFAYASFAGGSKSSAVGLAMIPLLAATIPLIDLFFAIWRRSARKLTGKLQGLSNLPGIMTGDLEHLHHRLMQKNLRPPDVAAILVLVNSLLVLIGLTCIQFSSSVVLIGTLSLVLVFYVALFFIPAPELIATGKLFYEIVSEVRSKVVALLLFIFLDCTVLLVSWLVTRSLSDAFVGILSATSFFEMFFLTFPILLLLIHADLFLGSRNPRLVSLLLFLGTLFWSWTYLSSGYRATVFSVTSTASLFLIRRSIAAIDKVYRPPGPVRPLEVSLYSRLCRKRVEAK